MPDLIDLQRNPPRVTLGTLSLPAEQYTVKAETPIVRKILCGGAHLITPLDPLPCTLSFSGRLPAADAVSLPVSLLSALTEHTLFDFSFCGADFSDMLLTAAECSADGKTAAFTVTMQGQFSAETEVDA